MGRPPDRPSVAQADPLPSIVPVRPGRLGSNGHGCDPAGRDRLLSGGGRGGPRSGRGAGACRDHRAGALPLPVPRRARLPPGDLAGLPAPRRRAGHGWRARRHGASLHGDPGGRHDDRSRHGLLPGGGGAGRVPRPRARRRAAGHRPGAGAAGQPHRRPRGAGRRCGVSAHRVVLRADARRLPEHDARCSAAAGSAAAWSGPAAWRSIWRRSGPTSSPTGSTGRSRTWPARSTCCGSRRRCWRGSKKPARCRGTVAEALGLVGRGRPGLGAGAGRALRLSGRHLRGWRRFRCRAWQSGDVFARAWVRWLEIQRSVEFIRDQLRALPDGPIRTAVGPLFPDHWSFRWSKAGAARSAMSP